jgi:hypothetical protein
MSDRPLSPIVLSAEMTDQGYWRVTWSLRAGLRLEVTATRVGISRSDAVEATAEVVRIYAAQQRGYNL